MEVGDNFEYLSPKILEEFTEDNAKHIEVAKEIAKDIETKKLTIFDTIKKLQCVLLSQLSSQRSHGILLLGETLRYVKHGVLSPEELKVLSTYFSEKLKDHHEVASSTFKGILALVNFPNISEGSIGELLSAIFTHIVCQQQQQHHRYLIFQILHTVLQQHPNEAKQMGIDFVYGVISSIDGERDPKNLLYLFSWLDIFIKNVKLGHLTEEMFEVLSCYFPVDFKAPPNDTNKITREALAEGLCKCLTCINDFGQYGIPLALGKLDSTLKIAKEDSLDILKFGCQNYDTQIYYQHSIEIWSQIQKEIFSTTDSTLKQKSLETLREILRKLSQGDQKNFEILLVDIIDTLKCNLLPASKLFTQSSQMLLYVAMSCETSSMLVAKKIGPLLENTFKISTNPQDKTIILRVFIDIVKAVIETKRNVDLSQTEEVFSCPALCLQAITDPNSDLAIEGFRGFRESAQLIPENVRVMYLDKLHRYIVEVLDPTVKRAMLDSFEKMAEVFPEEVENRALYKENLCDLIEIDNYLESLSCLVKVPAFEKYVLNVVSNYSLCDVDDQMTIALKHLGVMSTNFPNLASILVEDNFISRLVNILSQKSFEISSHTSLNKQFRDGIIKVLQSIMKNQESSVQKHIYLTNSRIPFKSKVVYSVVLSGLIIPLKVGVFDDYDKFDFLISSCLNQNDEQEKQCILEVSLTVLATVLNKVKDEQIIETIINKIENCCDNNRKNRIWFISFIALGLVTRNHPKARHMADLMLHYLKEDEDAPMGFKLIMDSTYYPIILKENDCQIMPLYKQKFFVYCTNKIIEVSQNDDDAHLSALGYLIENAPKLAVLGQFRKIYRLILLCLEKSKNAGVLRIILERITELITDGESVIEDHIEDILLRVLSLTTFSDSLMVRMCAINCIQKMIVTYKVYKLLPFKQRVLDQLGVCVDDKKRLVRRQAMECRSMWYLLDAPE